MSDGHFRTVSGGPPTGNDTGVLDDGSGSSTPTGDDSRAPEPPSQPAPGTGTSRPLEPGDYATGLWQRKGKPPARIFGDVERVTATRALLSFVRRSGSRGSFSWQVVERWVPLDTAERADRPRGERPVQDEMRELMGLVRGVELAKEAP